MAGWTGTAPATYLGGGRERRQEVAAFSGQEGRLEEGPHVICFHFGGCEGALGQEPSQEREEILSSD